LLGGASAILALKSSRPRVVFARCRRMQRDPPAAKFTIVDIARAAGVSIKTVSRVINQEEGVGAETRARVLEIVAAMGYRPNVSARSLSSRHHRLPIERLRLPRHTGG